MYILYTILLYVIYTKLNITHYSYNLESSDPNYCKNIYLHLNGTIFFYQGFIYYNYSKLN
jgi:hypothetical protein